MSRWPSKKAKVVLAALLRIGRADALRTVAVQLPGIVVRQYNCRTSDELLPRVAAVDG